MDHEENYTSLQEINEDISSTGKKPIMYVAENRKGICCADWMRKLTVVLIGALLISVSANIALLFHGFRSSTCPQVVEPTSLPPPLKNSTLLSQYSQLCQDYTDLAKTCMSSGVKVKQCTPCPDSWLQFEGRCYYFSTERHEWITALTSCKAMGSHLTILHNHNQHEFLEKEARELDGFDYHFWIGLSDNGTTGVWKWVDGTPVNKTYWDDSHDPHHSGSRDEGCAVLDSRAVLWFDLPCNFHYKWICETEALDIN